ncbi:MAG: NUDIX domain-containing protein [Candidatus Micrarchaeota archaeon]
MKTKAVKKGVVAIAFKAVRGSRKFLLLRRALHWRGWEFPKGGREGREPYRQTVLRELGEEAGIPRWEVVSITPTRLRLKFVAKSGRPRDLKAFLVEVRPSAAASLSRNPFREHSALRWVSAGRALRMLLWRDARKLFEEALDEVR